MNKLTTLSRSLLLSLCSAMILSGCGTFNPLIDHVTPPDPRVKDLVAIHVSVVPVDGVARTFARWPSQFAGSREFVAGQRDLVPITSIDWYFGDPWDQGSKGSCIGQGDAAARDAGNDGPLPRFTQQYNYQAVYFLAQQLDGWPGGGWPGAKPFREGSSVSAGVAAMKQLGWHTGVTTWAYTVEDIAQGLMKCPAVVGTQWYEGMSTPDKKNFVQVAGKIIGGHCWAIKGMVITGTSPLQGYFICINSWGSSFARNGIFFLSFDEARKLFLGLNDYGAARDGEAAFTAIRTVPTGWDGTVPPAPGARKKFWWWSF